MQHFLSLLDKAGFWSLPTEETYGNGGYPMDGSQWVFEGIANDDYSVVDRWSPKDSSYEQLCVYLATLSPVKLDEDSRQKGSP
ncbi:MAG TPA: hypothetical protein VFW94_05250 [Candidatus Acidoferrales bacterium]|nr:hypothetical protein [Candidatus Acidoferrales bacterium]